MEKKIHKNPFCFQIYADYEADIEIDIFNIVKKTTIFHKRNPVCNCCFIVSELDDVLKKGYCESSLGYDKVDWFVDEAIKLGKNVSLF